MDLDGLKTDIRKSEYLIHETKRSTLMKFVFLFSIVVLYFVFVSFQYGIGQGLMVTLMTWSFFVFCTPIADAGFLLDFPVRLATKVRMVYSETLVWIAAFVINIYSLIFNPAVYSATPILAMFRHILLNPVPFWLIIGISAVGTFISVHFGDEMIDVARHRERKKYSRHKNKYRMVVAVFLISVAVIFYYSVMSTLGISI